MRNYCYPGSSELDRRTFLRLTGLGAGALLTGGLQISAAWGAKTARPQATADSLVFVFMGGGQAPAETWDPKRYTPFVKGMKSSDVHSTFPSIPTSADGVKISRYLERTAKVMHHGALITSLQPGFLGVPIHLRYIYHLHTGYTPPQTVAAPTIGSIVARTLGPRHADVPAFVDIGQRLDAPMLTAEIAAAHSPGFLGSAYGPFAIPDPATAALAVRPPAGMSRERFEERFRRLEALQEKRAAAQDQPVHRDELREAIDGARRLLNSPAASALDLTRESKAASAPYGTGRFGQGCLLARRLIEAGVRFVEVSYEYEQFKNWDAHEDGHRRYAAMKKEIDGPLSQLIRDLDERKLLSRTLVVVVSEFGRSMLIEGISEDPDAERREYLERTSAPIPNVLTNEKNYGLHRHFSGVSSAVLFGGGIRGGIRYGATSDEPPFDIIEKPVSMADLHATIYRALGIPADLSYQIEGRPFFVTPDGKGRAVEALFA
ncbi:MAG: DUF1501 domain-containing protein [Planctomycetes bacterium]|nr:DUF1501 domain-containing protein [Planctomycetota bacterium]